MAMLLEDQSICPICGKVLNNNERNFSFPAFISNTKDDLYQFNDSSFHIDCLNDHPSGDKAIRLANQFIFKIRPENRVCAVGGNVIKSYEDYIFIDLLTSNDQDELFQYNLTTLDRKNLPNWKEKDQFLMIALKFKEDNKWGDLGTSKYLDNLIEQLKS